MFHRVTVTAACRAGIFGLAGLALIALATTAVEAQIIGTSGFIGRAVGGISIDASGVLDNAQRDNLHKLREVRMQALADVPGDLNQPNELRKISLRGLIATIEDCRQRNRPLPDEVKLLAGLQRIRYVLVYPDRNDIVLAGFGEGWKVAEGGELVGASTGRPVLLLDDLLVALRSAMAAAQGGISCSIDPTAEGLVRVQQALKFQKTIGPDPQATIRGIEQELGPQMITVTGVPATSHFARVLVAADYRMKRLAMNFDPPPVSGLPNYLQMMKPGSAKSMLPRWWLATNYDPLLTDEEGLAWELRGPGVKAMAEDDFLTANGERIHSGKANPAAQKWANNMTARYDALSLRDPIFGQLRNCMDLAVIAALIFKENLPAKASCDLSGLTGSSGPAVDEFAAPKQVDSKASFIQKGDNWIISASGGVMIHSWGVADNKQTSDTLGPVRTSAIEKARPASGDKNAAGQPAAWWWN